jgi:hypothetical protein
MKPILVSETPEFEPLHRGPVLRIESSRALGWEGFVVENHIAEPGKRPNSVSDRYIIALWSGPGIGEHNNGSVVYTAYAQPPGFSARRATRNCLPITKPLAPIRVVAGHAAGKSYRL